MFLKGTQNHRIPHIMMNLKGIFKGKIIFGGFFSLADKTKGGIPTRRWISQMLYDGVHPKMSPMISFSGMYW